MIIRIILLAGLASIGWLVFLKRNKMPFHIVIVFGLLAAGAIAVVSPETSSQVAHFVGVGRGADLVMYVSIVAILFVLVHYYTKFVELQRHVTQLTRELAILRADNDQTTPLRATSSPPAAAMQPEAAVPPANDPS